MVSLHAAIAQYGVCILRVMAGGIIVPKHCIPIRRPGRKNSELD